MPDAEKVTRVFWSSHLTPGHEAARQKWLSPVPESDATTEIRFSAPPFNKAGKVEFPASVQTINAPAFGPNISNAVMEMFKSPEMTSLAEGLKIHIPPTALSKFIQGKMPKVHDMIRRCRETPEIAESSAAAIEKLSRFVEEFEALDGSSIRSVSDWDAFVDRHAAPGWKAKMHFDHLLSNFGFEKEASDAIRRATITKEDGETATFEGHSCRWLGKALGAYGPEGCLVDVVNLVFAMTGDDPKGLSDIEIADRIGAFYKRITAKDTAALWIPTHFLMDAELDDCLAWVLLERILEGVEPRLSVLIQLPAGEEFDEVARRWEGRPGCEIWRDPDSRNAEPLRSLFLKSKTPEDKGSGKEEPKPEDESKRKRRRKGKGASKGKDAPGPKGKGKTKGEPDSEPKGKGKGKSKGKAEPELKGKGTGKGKSKPEPEPKGKGKGKGKDKDKGKEDPEPKGKGKNHGKGKDAPEPKGKGKGKDTGKGTSKSKAEPEPKGKGKGKDTGKGKSKSKAEPEPKGKGNGKDTGKGKSKSKSNAEPEPKGKGKSKDTGKGKGKDKDAGSKGKDKSKSSKSDSWDYPLPSSKGKKGSSKGKRKS